MVIIENKGVGFMVNNKKVVPNQIAPTCDLTKSHGKETRKGHFLMNTPKITLREGKSSTRRIGKQPVTNFSWREVRSTSKDKWKEEAKVTNTNKDKLSLIQRSSKKEKLKPSLREASLREASFR